MKLCECGCGFPSPVASRTDSRTGHIKGQPQRFIRGHSSRGRVGERAGAWRGGRFEMSNGYICVHRPDHPRANRGYVLEHILVAERALGRNLPDGAEVHHFDENPSNNVGGNLVICHDRKYHGLLHQRARALAACGNPSARRCYFCSSYDRQDDIRVTSQGKFRHRSCENAYRRARRAS